ncbi:CotH kinase family protein [Nonomuraea sp. NPDC005983]|uniref:CotH kinase family protein n=1 Tax=Nonomuraea sp. NPDC005983 TaxID=3155595 RepID=UPI0033A9854F
MSKLTRYGGQGDGDGVLYKSLASGSFSYKGEDQTEYTTDFKQIDKVGGKDLQPVIDLVKWVNEASDAELAKGLADRLDVKPFARYLALQNLMVNFDDMAGPGRSYYLWYDLNTKKFKVITWDLNLAFNGDAKSGVNDTLRMSFGPGRPQQGQPPQGFPPPEVDQQGRPGGDGMMRLGHPPEGEVPQERHLQEALRGAVPRPVRQAAEQRRRLRPARRSRRVLQAEREGRRCQSRRRGADSAHVPADPYRGTALRQGDQRRIAPSH